MPTFRIVDRELEPLPISGLIERFVHPPRATSDVGP